MPYFIFLLISLLACSVESPEIVDEHVEAPAAVPAEEPITAPVAELVEESVKESVEGASEVIDEPEKGNAADELSGEGTEESAE